ncbi:Eco29kI family restriction endonuclease [Streptomyces sp. NPDC048156]|uniref:Eco29kI family restriction endonuclease n=1 Tax=Streptomyces sp. NPDC048156 TaxID=3365502 RepID=UPI00372243DE
MATDPLEELSERLTQLRLAKGWNVNQLVNRCSSHLARTTISNALNARKGRKVPTAETVIVICRALGADATPLLELVRQARQHARTPPPGPQGPDRSRQFTREPEDAADDAPDANGLFNPLRRENLERSVQWALESATPVPLTQIPQAPADGLYALYYTGRHPLYRPVSSTACTVPVYVGKCRPLGELRGRPSSRPAGALNRRLAALCSSLDQIDELDAGDFQARYLPVEEIWMAGAERLMIGDHLPVWNVVAEGFGNHYPGKNRLRLSPRSLWDELHPGRSWATEQGPARLSRAELRRAVREHFKRTVQP